MNFRRHALGFCPFAVLFLVLSSCTPRYEGWHTIQIPKIGEFQLPHAFLVTQEENVVYITDKPKDEEGYTLYMIGTIDLGLDVNAEPNVLELLDAQYVKMLSSAVLSNSVIYALDELIIDGQTERRYYYSIRGSDGYYLRIYYWSEELDEDTAVKIAKTFKWT